MLGKLLKQLALERCQANIAHLKALAYCKAEDEDGPAGGAIFLEAQTLQNIAQAMGADLKILEETE